MFCNLGTSIFSSHQFDQFESETIVESSVESVPLYGHVSSTVTVAQSNAEQGPAKKKKQEPTSVHDSQGYVDMHTIMHGIALIIMLGLFFDISLKQDSHWSQLKVTGQSLHENYLHMNARNMTSSFLHSPRRSLHKVQTTCLWITKRRSLLIRVQL